MSTIQEIFTGAGEYIVGGGVCGGTGEEEAEVEVEEEKQAEEVTWP